MEKKKKEKWDKKKEASEKNYKKHLTKLYLKV